MLTIHAPAEGDAVLVEGDRLAAIGPYEALVAAHPAARVRRWPGRVTPGLVAPDGVELLERAYHPDPREADTLGTEPLDPPPFALDDVRRGGSARRGVQRLLARGVVGVTGSPRSRVVAEAVRRSGLAVLPGPDLPPLAVGGPARFAVFDGGVCVVTVVAGRLVHRER
ncbi:imidazolonepropionase-like domain-containing protein [Streptomyces crystallinus]|uniref:Aminodeoxyfutalosine deaminase/Imidazolonepropionase-like composite domain-containing protein n=1 Tax=Streptomyces crystallinus TaxID=68191 RepID=A0ABP3RZ39_9ACTN